MDWNTINQMQPMTPELLEYAQDLGPEYGTDISSIYLYAMVRMQRPDVVLELGTGLGTCAFFMAQALKENDRGHIWTVDDGSHWQTTRENDGVRRRVDDTAPKYGDYIRGQAGALGLADHLTLIEAKLPPYPAPNKSIDLLFSDFRHDPHGIIHLLATYLPIMSEASSIYIDSASTYYPSYLLLENLTAMFNRGTVPQHLLDAAGQANSSKLMELIPSRRFTLVHITEPAAREQNSMAWLKIEPHDLVPYPKTHMRE